MFISLTVLVFTFILLLLGLWGSFHMGRSYERLTPKSDSTPNILTRLTQPDSARIIVNVPADYKPLTTLQGNPKMIENEKALLWYTVYEAAKDYDETYPENIASQAVRSVYGS